MLNKRSIVAFAMVLCATLAVFADYNRWDWSSANGGAWFGTLVYSSGWGGDIYFNDGNLVLNGLYRCNNCNVP